MARTPSNMLPLGTQAPDFVLPDTVSDRNLSLRDIKGEKGTLVMFICNHCPFVKHVDEGIVFMANDYQSQGISFVAISSNDVKNYPQDGPELMKKEALMVGYDFPYLYDESQEVARAYDAACTPDFYLFDQELKCVYRGQMDGSRPGNNVPVTGQDLRKAMDALINDKTINERQIPRLGCGIKWKL